MNRKNADDCNKIPIKNYCQYLLLKLIASSKERLTKYGLVEEGRKIDVCEPSGMRYNKVSRLVDLWHGCGLVKLEPAYEGALVKWIKITPEGLAELERLRRYFEE